MLSEIKKNFWQDFSIHRLIILPLLLFLIVAVILWDGGYKSYQTVHNFGELIFLLMVMVWGGYGIASTINEEIRNYTWDHVKLSSLSPWQVVSGKLLGAPLFAWYGGAFSLVIICMGLYPYFSGLYPDSSLSELALIYEVMWLIFSAIFAHSLIFFIIMINQKNKVYSKFYPLLALGIGCFMGYEYYQLGLNGIGILNLRYRFSTDPLTVIFWQVSINEGWFIIWSLLTSQTLIIIGLYRLMRIELGLRNIPWFWGGFIIFILFYWNGLIASSSENVLVSKVFANILVDLLHLKLPTISVIYQAVLFMTSIIISAIMVYLAIFFEQLSMLRYRLLLRHWRAKQWMRLAENIPMWFIAFLITAIMAIVYELSFNFNSEKIVVFSGFKILLFVIRDVGLFHFFRFSLKNSKPVLTGFFYLLVLYFILPWAFSIGFSNLVLDLFIPIIVFDYATSILFGLFQASMAILLVIYRWRSNNKLASYE